MARKGILSPGLSKSDRPKPAEARMMPRGAVGALQSSLSKLQENAVQEIDAELIDDAGFEDRLGLDDAAQEQLKESLKVYGQQVPVLLRPHPSTHGRYEIVYGRRRLKALRELGLPIKAMVRQLDDHALVMAQGQENTARQDLSFIEKASFAAQLQEAGYDRPTICSALSIDLPMVSRMLKVGTAFPLSFLRLIGSAPSIGRERWIALVKMMAEPDAERRALRATETDVFPRLPSDERFEMVFDCAAAKENAPSPAPVKPVVLLGADGTAVAEMKRTGKGLVVTVPARTANGFDQWMEENADTLIAELHDRWQKDRSEG
ncbi:plasmid partitioning protein RepB [Tropicibacter naphthalenivorans]|uniref:Chromosome-partitioning protein ParB n=1 Tax=Tropicibacter naphthalenivorans TaxID=441103 RepID=A0A0P1GZ97_9RHOB|nr:plasmid partitioning protein RepB [Tropicibacter naphthalenivorans]CUH82500.1 Chromosome-partitioning protein ParB [Tropicibacter naphthalenivorans]SMD06946.1 chromosome partitioning protein, ParB family [Tropicibacter naphthalenivorans]